MGIKWGILGAGLISNDFTVCLRSLPKEDHQIIAVASQTLDKAKKFADKHHIAKAYGSYEELAEDPNVDIVYIGNLVSQHVAVGKMLLEHGKHLLVEKPFTLTAKGAEVLINLAREKKLFLMEAIWSRFNPVHKLVTKEIAAGTIGQVLYVHGDFGEVQRIEKAPRFYQKQLGGGCMLDMGIYILNAISMAYNNQDPLEIKAIGHVGPEGVETTVIFGLKYPDGGIATGSSSIKVNLPNEFTITGTKGSIRINKPFWCPTSVIINGQTREFPLPSIVDTCNFTNSNFLRYEAEHVRECLNNGLTESPILPLKDTLLIRKISDKIFTQMDIIHKE
ncbi:trans-1,2-dihydrobenzene-1,2-diol dehydrogenase-like [Brevipalpus obovatus]|uniref:trans-1,2-dihydrobenzene-1,2-diol dehydrogenase-like n=1 Tax=Brevipalpus obovatus TaxID=246614 RepID=UPI003D9E820A